MSSQPMEDFNPYYEWLSIPLAEQPADYYRLLGVPRFEQNERVIANAYDQKMYFLRAKQLGKFVQLSQQLQNEITAAQRVLLNPKQRADYDALLTESIRASTPGAVVETAATPPLFEKSPLQTRYKRAGNNTSKPSGWLLGLAFAATFTICAIFLLAVSGGNIARSKQEKTTASAGMPPSSEKSNALKQATKPKSQSEPIKPQPAIPSQLQLKLTPSPGTGTPVPSQVTTSQNNFALRFDGIDDHVVFEKLFYTGATPLTLEAWASLQRRNDDVVECLICDFEAAGVGLTNFPNLNQPRPFKWGFTVHADGYKSATQQAPLPRDTWLHLAGVFVPHKQVQFYVNGKLQSTSPVNSPFKPSIYPMAIAANPRGSTAFNDFFAGEIAALRISTVARYTGDFTPERYFSNDANTLALYRFEEGSGDILTDTSGHAHHGKIVGATWVKKQ